MRNKQDYQQFLMLKAEQKVIDAELNDLASKTMNVESERERVKRKLIELKDYENLDVEVIERLMSAAIYDSTQNPAYFNRGGGLTMPLDDFKLDSNGYKSLNKYQQKEFKHLEPYLSDCQLSLQHSLLTAQEELPNYDIDECSGVSRVATGITCKHPNYEDLTSEEMIQLREIIYKFAKYIIK